MCDVCPDVKWFKRIRMLKANAADAKAIADGGGPARVELVELSRPKGLVFTGSEVIVDVTTRDGTVVRIESEIPVPFPYAWAYRIGRRLKLPVVRAVDPESIAFEFRIPFVQADRGGAGEGAEA